MIRRGQGRRVSLTAARLLVAVQLAIVVVTLALMAVWSFADAWPWPQLVPASWSLRGYAVVFSGSSDGWPSLALSVGIGAASSLVATVAGAMGARALCCREWRGKAVFRFATMLPFLIPGTVFAMGVQVAFIRMGLARTVPGVVLAHAIVALPYASALMADVVRAQGTRLDDAARVLGAGRLATLFRVTIPSLAPGLLSALSMGFIISCSQYFLTLLVGGGKVRTFALAMFPYVAGGDRTIAAAYGVVFMAVTLAVFCVFRLLLRRLSWNVDDAVLYE